MKCNINFGISSYNYLQPLDIISDPVEFFLGNNVLQFQIFMRWIEMVTKILNSVEFEAFLWKMRYSRYYRWQGSSWSPAQGAYSRTRLWSDDYRNSVPGAPQPYKLYRFADKTAILDTISPGIEAKEYFDDRLADTLDATYKYGIGDPEPLITGNMIDRFDIQNNICHNDTISLSVYGNCDNNKTDDSINITFGYSKKCRQGPLTTRLVLIRQFRRRFATVSKSLQR